MVAARVIFLLAVGAVAWLVSWQTAESDRRGTYAFLAALLVAGLAREWVARKGDAPTQELGRLPLEDEDHPSLSLAASTTADSRCGAACAICLSDDPSTPWIELACGHQFHRSCATTNLRYRQVCAVCRAAVLPPALVVES